MPTYDFYCKSCKEVFEIFRTFAEYREDAECPTCNKVTKIRDYKPVTTTVIKGNTEVTVGHLAKRNRDTFSADKKHSLLKKHNEYKEVVPEKDLPKGISRIEKKKKYE